MSNFGYRKSLLFFPESKSDYKNFVEMDRWVLTKVSDFDIAKKLIIEDDYKVGMVFISCDQYKFLLHVKDLVSTNKYINWIALVDENMISNQFICEMIANYFYDYHKIPVDKHKLISILGHAYGMSDLVKSIVKINDEIIKEDYLLLGKSDAMKNVRQQIIKMAAVEKTILITGESGTGKELAVRALHRLSNRSKGPWVVVNSAALPNNLIQSELFGYEKGAFTGAHQVRIGKIEAANKGTIFLDEIGDISPDMQVALLRFLQEKTIERLGSVDSICLDVRVIAATHRDLKEYVFRGGFREDLYYRLNTLHLKMPPLRERSEDVIDLAYIFLNKFLKEQKKSKPKDFTAQSLQLIKEHSWPGNVRELMHRIERSVLLCDDNLISPVHLDLERRKNSRQIVTIEEARKRAEYEAIQSAIQHAGGNLTRAAELLDISRASLYRLCNINNEINLVPTRRKIKKVEK